MWMADMFQMHEVAVIANALLPTVDRQAHWQYVVPYSQLTLPDSSAVAWR